MFRRGTACTQKRNHSDAIVRCSKVCRTAMACYAVSVSFHRRHVSMAAMMPSFLLLA